MPTEFFPYDDPVVKKNQSENQKLLNEIDDFLKGFLSPRLLPKILFYLYMLLQNGLINTKEFAALSSLAEKYLRELANSRKEQQITNSYSEVIPSGLYRRDSFNKLIETLTADSEELYTKLVTKGLDDITDEDIKNIHDYINKLNSYNLASSAAYTKLSVLYFKAIMYKLKIKREKEE